MNTATNIPTGMILVDQTVLDEVTERLLNIASVTRALRLATDSRLNDQLSDADFEGVLGLIYSQITQAVSDLDAATLDTEQPEEGGQADG